MLNTEKTIPNDAFEEVPLDFDAYLGRRLGIDRAAAKTVLGRWLESYEPAPRLERPLRPTLRENPNAGDHHDRS